MMFRCKLVLARSGEKRYFERAGLGVVSFSTTPGRFRQARPSTGDGDHICGVGGFDRTRWRARALGGVTAVLGGAATTLPWNRDDAFTAQPPRPP